LQPPKTKKNVFPRLPVRSSSISSRVGTAGAAGYYATYYIIDDSRDQGQKVLIYFGGPSLVFFFYYRYDIVGFIARYGRLDLIYLPICLCDQFQKSMMSIDRHVSRVYNRRSMRIISRIVGRRKSAMYRPRKLGKCTSSTRRSGSISYRHLQRNERQSPTYLPI